MKSELSIRDTTLSFYRGKIPHSLEREGNPHFENYLLLKRLLGKLGFYVEYDKRVAKDWPRIKKDFMVGRYGDLKFKMSYAPNCFKITFYQDINFENPNGGYYDFDKRKKMPYLIGLQFDLILGKIFEFFNNAGWRIELKDNQYKGEAYIIASYIDSFHHPQDKWFSLEEIDGETNEGTYGCDRDGKKMYNGEMKYFRGYDGYLRRGKVYRDINGNWFFLEADKTVSLHWHNCYFDLSADEPRGRKKKEKIPEGYLMRKMYLHSCSTKELERELRRRRKNEKVYLDAGDKG